MGKAKKSKKHRRVHFNGGDLAQNVAEYGDKAIGLIGGPKIVAPILNFIRSAVPNHLTNTANIIDKYGINSKEYRALFHDDEYEILYDDGDGLKSYFVFPDKLQDALLSGAKLKFPIAIQDNYLNYIHEQKATKAFSGSKYKNLTNKYFGKLNAEQKNQMDQLINDHYFSST